MIVYVCSPYGGKKANAKKALEYCLIEVEMGATPYAPHCFFPQFLDEATDRYLAIQMGLEMLDCAEALHVWGNDITEGMQMEIDYANDHGIPVVYMGRADADS